MLIDIYQHDSIQELAQHYLRAFEQEVRCWLDEAPIQALQKHQVSLSIQSFTDLKAKTWLKTWSYLLQVRAQWCHYSRRRSVNTFMFRAVPNICIVGDDDQDLYRFRGATVENFVEFPSRCQQYLGCEPKEISLNINYRSRQQIVDFYTNFIDRHNWRKSSGNGFYRIANKNRRTAN